MEEARSDKAEEPWRWAVEPKQRVTSFVHGDFMCILVKGEGQPTAYLFTPPESGPRRTDFRPVLINGDGRRQILEMRRGGGNGLGFMCEYASAESCALVGEWRIGVEQLTLDAQKQIGVEKWQTGLHKCLPYPEVGKPYPFSLVVDGEMLSSEEFKGRAVIIHCWHTGCGPCLGEVPILRDIQARCGDRLVILGVNFDESESKAVEAVRIYEMTWPQVYVPNEPKVRDGWSTISTVKGFPRNFVVDGSGTLRADVQHLRLGAELESLLKDCAG